MSWQIFCRYSDLLFGNSKKKKKKKKEKNGKNEKQALNTTLPNPETLSSQDTG